ncbi:hypothetical protein MMC28_006686 [Mycoblastus sanguinarius]|nr:hypothetical protein [Mycoblastus sanguinarius]
MSDNTPQPPAKGTSEDVWTTLSEAMARYEAAHPSVRHPLLGAVKKGGPPSELEGNDRKSIIISQNSKWYRRVYHVNAVSDLFRGTLYQGQIDDTSATPELVESPWDARNASTTPVLPQSCFKTQYAGDVSQPPECNDAQMSEKPWYSKYENDLRTRAGFGDALRGLSGTCGDSQPSLQYAPTEKGAEGGDERLLSHSQKTQNEPSGSTSRPDLKGAAKKDRNLKTGGGGR